MTKEEAMAMYDLIPKPKVTMTKYSSSMFDITINDVSIVVYDDEDLCKRKLHKITESLETKLSNTH